MLLVSINGKVLPQLWPFTLSPSGELTTSAESLRAFGLDLRRLDVSPAAAAVSLNSLPGVRYRYLAPDQAVAIDVPDGALVPVVVDLAAAPQPLNPRDVQADPAAVLNYDLFLDAGAGGVAASSQYDLRFISPWGVLATRGAAAFNSVEGRQWDHVRLDTQWRYVDVRRVLEFTVGDSIADGGQLTGAYRFAGVQIRRQYDSRPDLVAIALPTLTATAAVPSALDVYLNGLRYFTGEVGRGPFQLRSLPNLGGGATATMVLTDANGRETRIRKPIFFVSGLLPPRRLAFSVEAGFPRRSYGIRSFDYYPGFVASGTVRYGVTDWLTVFGHAEGTRGLINGAGGAVIRAGGFGSATLGFGVSRYGARTSVRRLVQLQARVAGISLYAGSERTGSGYYDIATIGFTREVFSGPRANPDPTEPALLTFARRIDRLGANFSIRKTGVGLNYSRARLAGDEVRLTTLSLYRPISGRASAWINGYKDYGPRGYYGIFAGVSVAFSKGITASSSVAATQSGASLSSRITRNPGDEPGSWGWTVANRQNLSGRGEDYRQAQLRYLAPFATLEGGVEQSGSHVRLTAYAEGSVVAMRGIYLSPRIDTSFAVVEGAGPGTTILSNTRAVARANKTGRAIVTDLRSLERNVVSLDPTNLPVDLKPARTEVAVVPAERAGVLIDFGVVREQAAVVILVDQSGEFLPVGTVVEGEGRSPVVVGYDGRVFLEDLGARNRIRATLTDGTQCQASFDFEPVPGSQVTLGPITCQ